ncbi:hypothetical protein [Parenemella sanctibonifatiensis]|uniref:hypothetical protein n=1 Tax=Parenemella sanctibonifatiensis TaxID=2016505 RepID=UPI0015C67D02|nr:hypothetical protein [Parenemella sanctibonifatiensis]
MKTRSLSALVGMIAAALVTVALGAPPAAALTELTIHLSPPGRMPTPAPPLPR